jgi:hypothetical protein
VVVKTRHRYNQSQKVSPVRKLLIVLALLSSLLYSQNQTRAGGESPGNAAGTLTRSASRYHDLETRLLQALQDKNDQEVTQLLSDDFEMWSAEKTGSTSRREWQRGWFESNLSSFRIREITVRELGEIAVVSFLLNRRTTSGSKSASSTISAVQHMR